MLVQSFREGVAGMGDDLGCVVPVNTVDQHDGGQDDEGVPHHPPGQLDSQQHPRHGDPPIQVGFGADPIVDGLEVPHPVSDADDGQANQQIVDPSAQAGFGPVEEEHQDVGDKDVDSAVILGRGRIEDGGVGVEDHQGQRQDVEDPSLDPVQLLEHPDIVTKGAEDRACRQARIRAGRAPSRTFPRPGGEESPRP